MLRDLSGDSKQHEHVLLIRGTVANAGMLILLVTGMTCRAVIVLAHVLWIRPWIDDHNNPYA